MESLIKSDQIWVLWAILTGLAAVSIYLQQNYKWASKVTSSIIALVGGLLLSNLHIIPTQSPVYDDVWNYIIPLAIPMLLFNCNVKKIWKQSGRLLGMFVIGGIGTVLGAFIGYMALHEHIPRLEYVATIMTGSYIGGGVNFVALSHAFNVPSDLVASATVADNLLMALYFFVLLALPSIPFFRKHFSHPLIDEAESIGTIAATCEQSNELQKTEITIRDIAFVFASSFIIIAVSTELANVFSAIIPKTNEFLEILNSVLGNMYFILTTITMLLATFNPKFFSSLKGAEEIGMFFMAIFMSVIGIPASIAEIIYNAPLLLVFCGIMVTMNMLTAFVGAKIFKFNLEEAIIASNANVGGPATAPAMASAKGWTSLVGPSILVSVLGYVIGNYLGIIVGNILI
ncbi:DUF819 domain-containing protein [Clostridiisalibacter paucivorans]|uniref:DUF819 family protein n=1 Tax=Clostridiisalibacter paucivorans TaxID=408753 RepID=UPI00047C7E23|nr:DUF819 family protein [Clostridiisalibacter paucivorans]